jgi:aerobic-type carbon monoxide dehydrogenase small subunit (CoxS/CutS family)
MDATMIEHADGPAGSVRMQIEVNGSVRDLVAPPMRRLLDVLRDDLGLTGTKESCAVGVCGACSVLLDGELVSACLLPVAFAEGRAVTTVEGMTGPDGGLTALQEAFIREGGLQCGACTPGQVVAATALLRATPDPSDDEIRDWMAGNLCRCTGYAGILRAIHAAAASPA